MKFADYKAEIKKARTKRELMGISYKAFLEDNKALCGKNTLYNKVVTACVEREFELEGKTTEAFDYV